MQHRPQIHDLRPRDEGDIEFGVEKRMPPPIIRTKVQGPHHGHGAGAGEELRAGA